MRVVGIVAEQRNPGAHQVEVVFRPEKGARGIRETGARGRKGAPERAKPAELAAVGRRPRLVRACEVTHQQGYAEAGPPGLVAEQRIERIAAESEPVDPGLDVKRGARWRAVRRDASNPPVDAVEIEQAGDQAVLVQGARFFAGTRHEYEDLRAHPRTVEHSPKLDRLVAERGEEDPASRPMQGAGEVRCAEPVAVRLDHRGDQGGRRGSDGPVVPGHSVEIDEHPRRAVLPVLYGRSGNLELSWWRASADLS